MTSRNLPYEASIDSGRVVDPEADSFPVPHLASTPRQTIQGSPGDLATPRPRPQVVLEDTPSRTEAPMTEAMTTLAQSLSALVQQFTSQVTRMNSRREKPTQTFSGLVHENPAAFTSYMNQFFNDNNVYEDSLRIDIFKGQLKDAAKRWVQAFEGIPLSYQALEDSFLHKYNSITDKSTAISILYGEKQKTSESVEIFINRKRSLFARLNPNLEEAVMTQVLIDQLLPPLRSRLRGRSFQDVAELAHHAVKAESDLQEEANYWRSMYAPTTSRQSICNPPASRIIPSNPPMNSTPRTTGPSVHNANFPPTPCRFCQQWHYHRECPQNPYVSQPLNFTRATDSRGDNQIRRSAAPDTLPRPGSQRPAPTTNTQPRVNRVEVPVLATSPTPSTSNPQQFSM